MEINKLNFEQFKSDRIVNPFEDLDVNADGKIDYADKNATTDMNILNQISILLTGSQDEDDDLELIDDFDEKAGASADCPDGNCEVTAPSSTNDCPGGNCSVSAPASSTEKRTNNPDGTYTETITNASGQTIVRTFDANGKRISQKTTNKDGSVVNFSFKYNEDGSYTQTAVYSDKTRITKYNTAGKAISYTETYKNGTKKTATFKYNSDGSYSVIIKNQKSKSVTTVKYNKDKKKTSSVTKNKQGKKTKKTTYKYNADGSYKVTETKYNNFGGNKVKITDYDASGKKIKSKGNNTIATATASNYKDQLNKNGITFVIFTGPNCGHCDLFHKTFKNVMSGVSGLANFVEINSKADNDSLLWTLQNKVKTSWNQYPIIVKFVNGKATEAFHPEETDAAKLLSELQKKCSTSTK